MAPLPDVPSVFRVLYRFSRIEDTDVLCRTYWEYGGGPPSGTDCAGFAATIYASFITHLQSHMDLQTALEEVRVTDLTSGSAGDGTHIVQTLGTESGAPLSAATAVLQNLNISRRYRGGKPRTYWPLFNSTDLSNPGEWGAANLTAFNTAMTAHRADILAATEGSTIMLNQVNVSYVDGYTWVSYGTPLKWRREATYRATPLIDVINGWAANLKPASQRRRNLHGS